MMTVGKIIILVTRKLFLGGVTEMENDVTSKIQLPKKHIDESCNLSLLLQP